MSGTHCRRSIERGLEVLEGVPQLHQHQDDLIDFSDTAALIECLDLVITVDTSVAHLAGALVSRFDPSASHALLSLAA